MSDRNEYEYNYATRSLFWPILLIGLGGIFLMQNLGYIENISLSILLRLWPLLIVAAGINLLFRKVRWVGSVVGALMAVAAVAFLVYAPQLGIVETPARDLQTEFFSEAKDGAETLDAHLDMDYGQLTVDELIDSTDLITVEIAHRDNFEWSVSGNRDRKVSARLEVVDFLNPSAWLSVDEVFATVLISPDVPLELDLDQGSGTVDLDLSGFELISFEADTGAGTLKVDLPTGQYPVDISSGAGTIDLTIEPEAIINLIADIGAGRIQIDLGDGVSGEMRFDIGSGSVEIRVPEGVGVQVRSDTGVGAVRVPSGYVRINGSDNSGVWESPDYDDQETQIILVFDLGAGQVVIKE